MAALDPTIIQTALLQVAEATKAASEAAKAVQLAQQQQSKGASGSSGQAVVDWSKLVNKPPCFEHSTVEAEIKAFGDWSWQVTQYLATIDSAYDDELRKVFENPSTKLDMDSASLETRTRGMKLYGLLASLVRGKALNIVKSVGNSDGYEALRQMVLALRPNNNNRGLALLTAATSWPAFNMGLPLQPQVLKLEEVFEESRKSGTDIQDAVKSAIVMRCVSGQLRTHLNLGAQENMTYASLRELKWDSTAAMVGLNHR